MRKLITSLAAVVALAGVAGAAPSVDRELFIAAVTVPTQTVSSTSTDIRGYIEEITLDVPSAGATGTVSVVATPEVGAAVVLYTNAALTGAVKLIPRYDGDGAITNTGANYIVLCGDSVRFSVTPVSATSNVNWKAVIKLSR
jgi:hypothetical protein